MESFALKYRPRRFEDLVGQQSIPVCLRQMVIKNAVPTALLFEGPKGTGKTTSLRIFAAALNCDVPPGPCGNCVPCKSIFGGTSLDLREIDGASNGLVDDIRVLRQQVLYATGGNWQVVGIDEAHGVSRAGFNALLKTLEEPPPQTVFVLLTTEPGKIPKTIADRCMPFNFRRVPVADMTRRLDQIRQQESLSVDPALLGHIAERADGAMRNAVMTLDQVSRVGIDTIDQFTHLLGEPDTAPALLTAIADADIPAVFTIVDEQMSRTGDADALAAGLTTLLRDILILRCGGTLTCQGDALTRRTTLAAHIDASQAVAALTTLWNLKVRVRPGDDSRSSLDLAVVMLTELFAARKPAPAAEPAAKLTFAEMAAIRRDSSFR